MKMHAIRAALLALALVTSSLTAACDLMSPERDLGGLAEARARWEALGQDDYVWQVHRACFCGGPYRARIEVVDGEVVAVWDLDTGERAPDQALPGVHTVDGLLDEVERALREADAVEVRYDDVTGAPLVLDVDWAANAIDDEIRWETTRPEW